MKRKKLWIILGVVCACIFTLGMVIGLAFNLKKVDVEFLSRAENTRLDSEILSKVKQDGEFKYGKNLLFLKLDDSIAKIEKANPYVKVESVKKHFPNVVRVHISERIPRYRIRDVEDETKWYIVDSEFKILEITLDLNASEFYEKTVEIDPETASIKGETVGTFIAFNDGIEKYLNAVCDGVYGKTKDEASAYSISIETGDNGEPKFTVTMRNSSAPDGKGCKIVTTGADKLTEKVVLGVATFVDQVQSDTDLNTPANSIIVTYRNGQLVAIKPAKQG